MLDEGVESDNRGPMQNTVRPHSSTQGNGRPPLNKRGAGQIPRVFFHLASRQAQSSVGSMGGCAAFQVAAECIMDCDITLSYSTQLHLQTHHFHKRHKIGTQKGLSP